MLMICVNMRVNLPIYIQNRIPTPKMKRYFRYAWNLNCIAMIITYKNYSIAIGLIIITIKLIQFEKFDDHTFPSNIQIFI